MRRVLALIAALALAVVVAVPVAAFDQPAVNNVVVTSIVLDKYGGLTVNGTAECINMDVQNLQVQGSLTQAIGHKTTITGWIGTGVQCTLYGTIIWQAYAQPNGPGVFGPGWVTGNVTFTDQYCDNSGCYGNNYGYANFAVKVTKR
jgi:hypothetical protein